MVAEMLGAARVLACVLACALACVIGFVPTAQAVPSSQDDGLSLTVTGLDPQVLHSGDDLSVAVTVTNSSGEPVDDAQLLVQVQRSTEVSVAALGSWLEGARQRALSTVETVDLDAPVPAGETRTMSVTVPADALPLQAASQWGPRGVQVSLVADGDVRAWDRTVAVWDAGTSVDPTRMTVIVPVVASPSELSALAQASLLPVSTSEAPQTSASPSATSSASASATSSPSSTPGSAQSASQSSSPSSSPDAQVASTAASGDDAARAVLARVSTLLNAAGPGVVLAVDPALLAALGVLSDSGASGAQSVRASLRSAIAAGSVLLLPWQDADVSALAAIDQAQLIAEAYARTAEAVASDSALAGALTTTALATSALDLETLSALPSDLTSVVASPWDMPVRTELTYTPSGTTSVNGRTVLVPEPGLSGIAAGTSPDLNNVTADPQATDATTLDGLDTLQMLRAATAILTRQAPNLGRNVIVSLPRALTQTDAAAAVDRVHALIDSSWTTGQGLGDLLTRAVDPQAPGDQDVTREDLPQRAEGTGGVTTDELSQARTIAAQAQTFGSVLGKDAATVIGTPQDIPLAVSATSWRAEPQSRSAFVSQASVAVSALSSALTVAPSSTINVIASSADLPVRVRSTLPVAAQVRVRLIPSSLRLQAVRSVDVTVPAHGEATVSLPIKAVGSGDVSVRVEIVSADSTPIGTPMVMRTRVRADWENLGTITIAVLLASMMVIGIVRTVRRGRRLPDPDQELREAVDASQAAGQAAPSASASTDPAPSDPASTDPAPTDPAPSDPAGPRPEACP